MTLDEGDFVLPVDKPVGPTSHDVVAAARRALGTRRVGHTGTLDPFASGLMLLCVGRTTRLAEYLSGLDKCYEATACLGIETDTLDRDGTVTERVALEDHAVDREAVRAVLETFLGPIDQVPPQYSAKKVSGEAMHRRARRGERVELPPVPVTVHEISLTGFEPPEVRFSMRCSSGTYVRSIAFDLGRALGVGAHLTELRRTAVGGFEVDDALPVEALGDEGRVLGARVDPVAALAHLPSVSVDAAQAARLRHGQRLRLGPDQAPAVGRGERMVGGRGGDTPIAVVHERALVAMGELDDGVLRPRKVFAP